MTSWNVIICSDGNVWSRPVVIRCPDPTKWTSRDMRSEAGNKLGYPEEDLMLYCNEAVLPEGKPLTECEGLKNGVALLATIKPSTVHVFCPHIDATLQIDIPRREWGSWTGATLRTVVCFKLGIDPASSQNDILALEGESLHDLNKVSATGITGGKDSLLTYTRIQQFQVPLPTGGVNPIFTPSSVTRQFASGHTVYNRDVSAVVHTQPTMPSYPKWLTFWTITVQQLNGTKTSIKLPNINRTPIYKLRELVKKALSIPTHQQKLTLGGGSNNTIVLEDWDEEGRAMAIAHYPSLHDGATLYLVQLTKAIRVKVVVLDLPGIRYVKSGDSTSSTLPSTIPLSSILLPSYVNIHLPHKFSLNCLTKIMSNKSGDSYNFHSSVVVYCQSTGKQFSPSDAPVSSVKWIVDGCTLTFTEPRKPLSAERYILSKTLRSFYCCALFSSFVSKTA